MVREAEFQARLIRELKALYPHCIILKNDPNYIQGIPDLLVLVGDRWFALEVKRAPDAPVRPNQDYYVAYMNDMSYAAYIHPDNKEQIFGEIQNALRSRR